MRRYLALLLLMPLFLTACGGGDITVPDPPAAQPFTSSSPQVDAIIEEWRTVAWEAMAADAVKPETKVEAVFQSTASLEDIETHYGTLTTRGWWRVRTMPGLQGDVLFAGYEQGTTAIVIGAIDASKFGGEGTVIYTLMGTK
jgi:hypothetical protein